ncbi:MAG: TIGR03960 family B12-binding radical SAM protein, partial [Deltaproteobacteria bacterium]|nr:TIGR03960 family B12-binding radical SAM protein [Deltaproteobacteria bacterium]
PRIACERAFSPWGDCEAQIRAHGLPLVTLESADPLGVFDVIGMSLQYELTYTNVLNVIDLAGLPLRAADRGDQAPLILCGGPTATHPEPLAPFIDAFFIGEAEEALPALVLDFAAMRKAGVSRRERLIQLAARYPLYVPELYTTRRDPEAGFIVVDAPIDTRVPARPKRVWVADINRFPFPDDSPLPYGEAIFDRMAVEVARGCTEGCRFCQAGMIYRPVRERDPVQVIETLLSGVKKGGYDETSLTSLSTADYSCVTPLVKTAMAKLRDEKVSLSVSSLRAYGLNDDLLAEMATMRAGGLTFAPEAGTQRMRDVITKNVTEEDIIESAHRVFSRGFHRMKLYFMIGLPTETDEDVRGIVETAARVQAIGRRYQAGAMVVASVSTHVPKPHTPFQWAAMDSEAETARKQGLLAQVAQKLRVDLKMHENYQSHLEAIFSRGDRAVADILERAFRLGCRFDSWDEQLRMDLWDQAIDETLAASGLDLGRYLGTIPVTAHLPWDHIDIDLEGDFLLKEYRKALKDRLSPPCGKPFKKLLHPSSVAAAEAGHKDKLICYDCGVACDLGAMKQERLFYLRRMNAWTKPVDATPVSRMGDPNAVVAGDPVGDAVGDGPVAKPTRADRTRPPTRITQGEAYRVRLRYTKVGRVAFLGHLDLVRHLPRIFRRAGVELNYSIGFHPKPELSFGPALGLGIPSLGELLDVKLGEPLAAAELVRRLQIVTLDGVDWLGGVTLGHNDRALGRVIARAEFWARLPVGVAVETGIASWTAGGPIAVKRRGEGNGVGRMIDVRRAVVALDAPAPDMVDTARIARSLQWDQSEDGDRDLVRFRLLVSAEGSAKPIEVIEGLWGAEVAAQSAIARVALWAVDGASGNLVDPLDADALRRSALTSAADVVPENASAGDAKSGIAPSPAATFPA